MKKLTDILKEVFSKFSKQELFHGTTSRFDKFDIKFFNAGSGDNGWLGYGVYLTNDYAYAESYAEPNGSVLECNITCNRPYILTDYKYSTQPLRLMRELGVNNSHGVTQKLKSDGYDCVLLTYSDDGEGDIRGDRFMEVCVFDSNDIKIIKHHNTESV